MRWVGVNCAIHYVVKKQNALITVPSVGINYVHNSLYEIGHTMYRTAA
jgi:hypothetical protein